jgi:RNA polymerase sigma-70 factor (ECF subfamily)
MDALKTRGPTPGREKGAVLEDRVSPTNDRAQSPCPPLSAEQVYHDYAPRVYSMARRMVRSDIDAEDVTQDVLLQVVRKLPSFRGESAFPTWLHRVTVNAALSHRRRQAVRQEHGLANSLSAFGEDADGGITFSPAPGPEAEMLSHETRELIERAIDSLPPAYRSVFILADVEELPNAEIAAHLGLSLPAIKSRLHRARLMMRDALAPHFATKD